MTGALPLPGQSLVRSLEKTQGHSIDLRLRHLGPGGGDIAGFGGARCRSGRTFANSTFYWALSPESVTLWLAIACELPGAKDWLLLLNTTPLPTGRAAP